MKSEQRKKTNKANGEIYFRRYLQIAPLGLALWRAVEARHMSTIKLFRPILDVGCGWGEFAEAFGVKIDMGIDIAARDLYVASKAGMYKNLTLADARDLPFSDNSFGSIISISTLEHIPNTKKLLHETFRVLKQGGILAITMETEEVDKNTFYRPLFKKIGFTFVSDWMTWAYNTKFNRRYLPSKELWRKHIEHAGFEIVEVRDIISPTITRLYDLFILTSWPAQIFRPLIGRRKVFRPKVIENLMTRVFLKYINEKETVGTNLMVVARKPSR